MNGVVIHTIDTMSIEAIKLLSFVDTNQSVFILPESGGKRQNRVDTKFGNLLGNTDLIAAAEDEYGYSFAQNTQIGIETIHNRGYRGEGMRIAVIDAGFSGTDTASVFRELYNEGRVIAARDFVQSKDTIDYDYSGHGTNVLGTISSNSPNFLVGTAPKAEVVLLRSEVAQFEYIIEEYHWVAAAEFADSIGVDVCNTSLGYTTFDDERQNHTYLDLDGNTTVITRGANIAAETGMLIVNSAGNSGGSSWRYMGAPADGDLVLAVGAVDSNGLYVGFSSIGPNASGDVKPNVMAQGLNVATIGTNNELTRVPGTSFSSPIIAGAAACLWQANPNKTALEIKEMIEKSAHLYDNPNDLFGYGIPNFARADWPTGITEVEEELHIAYPNPANQELNISKSTGANVEIFTITGELVLQKTLNTSKLDISSLEQGIYMLNVDGAQQKLIIQR